MISVLLSSFATHAVWVGVIVSGLSIMPPRHLMQTGMYFMTTTAGGMAFVYPVVLQAERFGEDAAAIVVMWEFGGNIIVAILLFGIVCRFCAPPECEEVVQAPTVQ